MFGLKTVSRFLRLFSHYRKPWHISLGFGLGAMLGLMPSFSWFSLLILMLLLIVRTNFLAAFVAYVAFGILAFPLDPILHELGHSILTSESLKSMFTDWYNTPWIAATRFYNTIVFGSLVSGFVIALVSFPIVMWLVLAYQERIKTTKFYALISGNKTQEG